MRLLLFLAAALLLTPAASGAADERVFPVPAYHDALVVPATSPVILKGFAGPLDAAFTGHLVLTGVFTYGCQWDCEGAVRPSEFVFYVIPDPALAAGFPHWAHTHNDMRVAISDAEPFLRSHITPKQRAALASGKLREVTGRVAIVVDQFHTSVECGTAFWSAHFVAMAGPLKVEPVRIAGDFGCGGRG